MTAWRYPMNNLLPNVQHHEQDLINVITKVVSSGWFVLGPESVRFEDSFARYLGVQHCVGVANGTDAIEIALKATGIKRGDVVATSANAGMYSTSAINAIGATPLYTDVCPNTHCMSRDHAADALGAGAKAIIVTHLYGLVAPQIREIACLCESAGAILVEDCAQAHGANLEGTYAGTHGDAASFSFYPTKNLGCLGDGGAVISNSAAVASQARQLRQYGWKKKYNVATEGGRNSRLDELQAAVLSHFLPHLKARNERRREIARHYSQFIQHPDIKLPPVAGENYVAHLYVIQTLYRISLREHLEKHRIQTEVHYPVPDHKQLECPQGSSISLPVTERLAKEVLTIPCFPEMSLEHASEITEVINEWKP